MIFALGFLSAGLLTLMFLPAIWGRALRLTRRRLEQRLPVSMEEVAAERDQLRAEFAIDRRRIEQANESLIAARAKDMAELSRRGARIASLQSEVESTGARVRLLEASLEEAERRAAHAEGVWSALEKEVLDSTALSQRRMEDGAALQRGILAASDLAETRRAQVAGLEAQVEALEAERDDLRRDLAHAQLRLAEKTSAAELFAKERDFARSDLAAAHHRRDSLQKELEDVNTRLAEREVELREAQRVRARLANEIADQARALEAGQAIEAELRAHAAAALTSHRDDDRKNAAREQELRAERDSLRGALEAARHEARTLREELQRARHAPSGQDERGRDDELLRRAISDLGADVLRLSSALERQGEDPDATAAERVQRLQQQAGRASSLS
jgi:chromosome segregation ATPase